jgi:GT2 family glycosyltransferase
LWAVNTPVLDGCLVDVGPALARKRAALAAHASQLSGGRLERALSADAARALDVDVPGVQGVEAFTRRASSEVLEFTQQVARLRSQAGAPGGKSGVTAVVSTWNKRADLRENLLALEAQTLPFDEIVVVDNASTDGTAAMVKAEFPRVRLVVMPHDRYGACETFNVGFASATTEYTAILDDDIVMQPQWVEKSLARMRAEPESTAIVSTQVVEPGTPESYLRSPLVNSERYMSTFRGCASLAKSRAIREAGWYDINHFIYGNERDLTCRLLNLGWRVLQYPGAGVWHKTPFGIKMGKRSLYYHARNAFLTMLKYAPAKDLAKLPFLVLFKVVLRGSSKEAEGSVADATGTIGIGRSLKETPGAWWVLFKACASIAANIPYCWKRRQPCRHPDFELPLS